MELLPFLDLASTLVFALVGARVAADKGLDYGGIAFIAAVASISGGTLRNLFLGLKTIFSIFIEIYEFVYFCLNSKIRKSLFYN